MSTPSIASSPVESAAPAEIQKDTSTLQEHGSAAVEESATNAAIVQESPEKEKEGGDHLSKDNASLAKDEATPEVEKAESASVDSNEKQQGKILSISL